MLFLLLLLLLLTPRPPFHCPAHTTVKFDDLQQRSLSPSPLFPQFQFIPAAAAAAAAAVRIGAACRPEGGIGESGKIVVSGCGGVLSEGGKNTRNETCEVKRGNFSKCGFGSSWPFWRLREGKPMDRPRSGASGGRPLPLPRSSQRPPRNRPPATLWTAGIQS